MTNIRIMDVTADAETGEWLSAPVDSGETTTLEDWSKMEDTDTQHFDTHIAWVAGDEVTTGYPGKIEVEDGGWKETEVALRVTWA